MAQPQSPNGRIGACFGVARVMHCDAPAV